MAHRLAPQVESDLDEIWYFVASESGNPEIANRLVDSLTRRFLLLAAYPYVGRVRNDLRPGLRGFPVGQYVILYRIEGNDVLILHVLHSRRDLDGILRP
jgi:toxin ParE1/3/4